MICASAGRVADRQLTGDEPKTQHARGRLHLSHAHVEFFTFFLTDRAPDTPLVT